MVMPHSLPSRSVIGTMESGESRPRSQTLSAYDFAMDEVGVASSNLARALLARTITKGAMPETECAEARRVYDKMIDLFPRVRLDESQRASLLNQLAILRARLEECEA
jgi:hypothetical protein